MARIEGGAVIIDTDWPGLKLQIDSKNINFRYEEDNTAYQIFAIDGQYIYATVIYKSGQAPQNQNTYDVWRDDFELYYKNRTTDFSSTNPIFLTNNDGYSIILQDGYAVNIKDGYGIGSIGTDGYNYHLLKTDTSGRLVVVGAGTVGTSVGGILSIQGVAGGVTVPISGSISALNSSTSATTSVAASASNTTLLSANSNRLGATIFNDSTIANLFVKLGSTASLTSFTVRITPYSYYEVPFNYTGIIAGIWNVAIGDVRITEFSV